MTNHREWTYFRYGLIETGDHLTYLRYRGGIAEGLNTTDRVWVQINGNRISRYIENGEMSLNDITREKMEAEVGFALPT